jgi:hypothetical protein
MSIRKTRGGPALSPFVHAGIVELCHRGNRSIGHEDKDLGPIVTAARCWAAPAEHESALAP